MITTKDSQSHLHTKKQPKSIQLFGKSYEKLFYYATFCDSSFWIIVYLLNGSVLVSGTTMKAVVTS